MFFINLQTSSKWLKVGQYLKIRSFLGKKVVGILFLSILLSLFASLIEVALAYALQAFFVLSGITERAAAHLPKWMEFTSPLSILGFFFGVVVLRGVSQGLLSFFQSLLADQFKFDQRKRLIKWVYASRSINTAQIVTLFNERSNSASRVLLHLQVVLSQLSMTLFFLGTLFYIAPGITLYVCIALGAFAFPLRWVSRRVNLIAQNVVRSWDETNSRLIMSVRNLLLLRIYGTAQEEEDFALAKLSQYLRAFTSYYRISSSLNAVPQIIGIFAIAAIYLLSTQKPWGAPAMLLSYFYIFLRFNQSAVSAITALSDMSFYGPQLGELASWWANHSLDGIRNPKKTTETVPEEPLLLGPIGWRLSDMSFSYPGQDEVLFKDLQFNVKPGEALVVTGPSGVGKSTLLNLLIGELEPTSGKVELVVANQTVTIERVKSQFLSRLGYVGPESFFMEGTIRTNILYGLSRTPSENDLRQAIDAADCGFVYDLSDALEHRVTEQGQGLSAGQKQRLALVRALLRKPSALILDEATSNLDPETERNLVETIRRLKGKTTVIAVTHREALLDIADQHFRLGKGSI
jgi:ABC-type multidrug transport system fused ATPase/permease subunit